MYTARAGLWCLSDRTRPDTVWHWDFFLLLHNSYNLWDHNWHTYRIFFDFPESVNSKKNINQGFQPILLWHQLRQFSLCSLRQCAMWKQRCLHSIGNTWSCIRCPLIISNTVVMDLLSSTVISTQDWTGSTLIIKIYLTGAGKLNISKEEFLNQLSYKFWVSRMT